MATIKLSESEQPAGQNVGVSDGVLMCQSRIKAFADATADWQFILKAPTQVLLPYAVTISVGCGMAANAYEI